MLSQQNIDVVRRFYEQGLNQRNPTVIDAVMAPAHVYLSHPPQVIPRDRVKQSLPALPTQQSYEVLDLVASGDKVAARIRLSFVHDRPINNHPPTGRKLSARVMSIFRLAGGLIEEMWEIQDNMSVTVQTLPQPAPGASFWMDATPQAPSAQPGPIAEANVALIRRVQDELNRRNLAVLDGALSPAYVLHGLPGGATGNKDTMKAALQANLVAFPDIIGVIDDIFAAGNKVVVRTSTTGTQTGPLQDLAPTGRRIQLRGGTIYEVANNQIVAQWSVSETFEMLRQLRGMQ